jgi:hypothetical protein
LRRLRARLRSTRAAQPWYVWQTKMGAVPLDLGFSVADGEQVSLVFSGGDLLLSFIDWCEHRVEHRFKDALAFRWSSRPTVETPRDDSTFVVPESSWLAEEVRLEACSDPENFAHQVLCFNAEKVLEVLSRRGAP